MKKTWIIFLSAFIFACNSGDADKAAAGTDTTTTKDQTASTGADLPPGITQDDYDKGLNLVATSDCLTCHQINAKSTGPAYADIAKKYEPTEENINMLAGKVIKGGSGVWGQVPMLPHDGLPEDEAKAMVKYVLSLKNVR
jgi:cytochrome c